VISSFSDEARHEHAGPFIAGSAADRDDRLLGADPAGIPKSCEAIPFQGTSFRNCHFLFACLFSIFVFWSNTA
ncbi:MAG: hypothetical protein IJJ42_00565, partial [Clostridia bacterium]|nr:hypothetical protein [Clostridia bacterium]